MKRWIEPELLDHLSPDDPKAIASRGDLRRVNAWMRNASLLAQQIAKSKPVGCSVLELGAGDGTFLLQVLKGARIANCEATLLDAQRLVSDATLNAFAGIGTK